MTILFRKEKSETLVNPTSEKPKIGRGVLTKETNGVKDRKVDRCLSPLRGTEHGL